MTKRTMILLLLIAATVGVANAQFVVKSSTDEAFPIVLVDETDGYTSETEKKAADTTVTYCNITDGNSVSTYTDDDTLWDEVGDGTGEYKLVMGAGEFTHAGDRYLVKVVVSGCRTARFWVDTITGDPNDMATTTAGAEIPVDPNGLVKAVLHDLATGSGAADTNDLDAVITANASVTLTYQVAGYLHTMLEGDGLDGYQFTETAVENTATALADSLDALLVDIRKLFRY